MVKAGVFLLARLYPTLGGSELRFYLVSGTGLVTMTFGAAVAIFQQDLKGLLAYSTISQLGLITLLFGLDSRLAVVAGLFHILNHAVFKASLFMATGIIDHETGSRDMRQLNGMLQFMPITGTLAMAVTYSVRFIHDVLFNGQPVGLDRTPHEPPHRLRVSAETLVVCLAVGIFPEWTIAPMLAAMVTGTLGKRLEYSLALWHGFNTPLLMSIFAMARPLRHFGFGAAPLPMSSANAPARYLGDLGGTFAS
jgi:multicomponent K+:H+ antiporter subunit A